jgi:hypothetical protein
VGPGALRPGKTREQLTAEAAEQFASLALALRSRGHDPQRVAHFLNKLLFIGHADRGNRAAGLLVDCLKCVACSALVELLPSILQEVTMPAATTDRSSSASISADGRLVVHL